MRRISIRVRLMILMICLTTLPAMILTWLAADNTRSSVEAEIINANKSRMLWADQYLSDLIEQVDILFYTLQINQQLMDNIAEMDNSDIATQYRAQYYIQNTMNSVFYANSTKIDNLILYTHSSKRAISVNFGSRGLISPIDIQAGPWSRMITMPINMYFKQSLDRVYAFHSINRFEDQKLLGGIAVRVDKKVWSKISDILKSENESSIFLINDEGELLPGSSELESSGEINEQLQDLELPHSDLQFLRTDAYFYFMKRVDDGQLYVVKAIPIESINKSALVTIKAGIFTGGLFTLASILLSILVSLRISRPIVSLARTMKTAQPHNFEIKSVYRYDEIGLLEHGYNSMMKRIKELIEVEYKQEIELRDAQLKALQAQINPHFLNNSLNMIGGMALSKNAPEIYQITRVIGDLLRYSISSEGDLVSLQSELKHMQNYMFIQENRFAGRCTIMINVDESAVQYRLPKFTLQPLLENAFEHGLQKKEGSWVVKVRIQCIGDRAAVMIKDEGVGMSCERLKQLRMDLRGDTILVKHDEEQRSDTPSVSRGLGLKNVDSRLKLHFGKNFGLKIYSKQGMGTLIVVLIPISKKDGEANV